jgi:unspecific monooxygenase
MTMETVFGALLARTRSVSLLDEPVYKRGLTVRGPQALRVALIT